MIVDADAPRLRADAGAKAALQRAHLRVHGVHVEFAKRGDINIGKMVSRKVKLSEINDAFRAMLEGEVIRSVLVHA